MNGLKNQVSQFHVDKTDLQNQVNALDDAKNGLESQVNRLQTDKESLQDQISVLEQSHKIEVDDYLETIQSLNADIKSLETYIEYLTNALQNAQNSQPMQEKIRESVMYYIKISHPETSGYMQNLTWSGGFIDTETYLYTGGDWTFRIYYYQEVPNPSCTIRIRYESVTAITWEGFWWNWSIAETTYRIVLRPGGP